MVAHSSVSYYGVIILGILTIILIIVKRSNGERNMSAAAGMEGFQQNQPFILKHDDDCYDEFYCQIHNKLFYSQPYINYCVKAIIQTTFKKSGKSSAISDSDSDETGEVDATTTPISTTTTKQSQCKRNKENATSANGGVLLDVGSGTGKAVEAFVKRGFQAYGIDKSISMNEYANDNCTLGAFRHGNVEETMLYETNTFTHITCLFYTFYYFNDKVLFLKNCHDWLQPNGYLIIHVVNGLQPRIPSQQIELKNSPTKMMTATLPEPKTAIMKQPGYSYESTFITKPNKIAIWKETFTDINSSYIRQHEKTLFMEEPDELKQMVEMCGFDISAIVSLEPIGAINEFLYFFQSQI